mmetsp:Transcript_6244/g.14200  ORF Transcript_6244/g.14200 Transcript_6244/m.14200 type:complete len:268 (+) Transcript_6244:22-825(+)
MGAAGSVPPLPKEKSAVGFDSGVHRSTSSIDQVHAGHSPEAASGPHLTGGVQHVQGGLQWLLSTVDKEKKEKEWLAKKFEEKCAEVQSLYQELQRMRSQLDQRGGRAVSSSSAFASPSPSPTSPVSTSQEISPASSQSAIAQRRGLKLNVETNPKRTPLTTQPPKVSIQEPPGAIGDSGSLSRAKSSPALDGGDPSKEPMSALLRRRKEDWTPQVAGVTGEEPLTPGLRGKAKVAQGSGALQVSADKVFSMDDCPASPKRVRNPSKP